MNINFISTRLPHTYKPFVYQTVSELFCMTAREHVTNYPAFKIFNQLNSASFEKYSPELCNFAARKEFQFIHIMQVNA